MLNKIKVGTRLILGFGIVMLFLSMLSIIAIQKLAMINRDMHVASDERYLKTVAAKEIAFRAMDNARIIGNIVLLTDKKAMAENKDAYDTNIARNNELFEQLDRSIKSETGKALLKQMHESSIGFRKYSEEVIRLGLANKDSAAIHVLYGDGYRKQFEYFTAINQVVEYQTNKVVELAKNASDSYASAQTIIILLSCSALAVCVGTAVIVIYSITGQLGGEPEHVVDIARKIAQGNFTTAVTTKPWDNQSILASIKQMQESLKLRDDLIVNKTVQLEEARIRSQSYLDTMQNMLMALDHHGNIFMINPFGCEILGYTQNELVGKNWFTHCMPQPEGMERAYPEFIEAIQNTSKCETTTEIKVLLKNGQQRLFSWYIKHLQDSTGKIIGILISGRDITNRKQEEQKLRLAASVFTSALEGIMITDTTFEVIDVNEAFSQITGFSKNEVIGKSQNLISSTRQSSGFYEEFLDLLSEKGHWYGEIWNERKNGEVYAAKLIVSEVRDNRGSPLHYVTIFSDITPQKEHERQLEHIAHYDSLTGLPNRILLADRLHQAIAQTNRREQKMVVLYIDLDGFKAINDNYGHQIGDQLLMTVSNRMLQSIREGDTVARIGGDEFVAVLNDLPSYEASIPLIERLLVATAHPVQVGASELQVSGSIGVTVYPQHEEIEADQLLRQADQAMYQAKLSGKNRFSLFDFERERLVRGQHSSLSRINEALERQEFVLYYQPKVNLRTGLIVGAEALIRWEHPERGLLPPAYFLPEVENNELGIRIGDWVINAALSQMTEWSTHGLNLPVSVNVSANHLQHPEFVERLKSMLIAHSNVPPNFLELEVLESSVLKDITHASTVIMRCADLGVHFALDDFGTGFSSLTYLKRLPTRTLKIDQSFVREMVENTDDLSILEGVLRLATAFNRHAVAEGVETLDHGKLLIQLGCEIAQGYAIAKPMPAENIIGWANTWKSDPSWNNTMPVSPENMPILYGIVEHRAWARIVESCLMGKRESVSVLEYVQCQFGEWLNKIKINRSSDQESVFQLIVDPMHHQIHKLAIELITMKIKGQDERVLERMSEFFHLRDQLLATLSELI